MQKIIVDGFNVIYTDDRLRRVACRDNRGARSRLIDLLEEYVERRDVQITVVFDGRGSLVDAEAIVPGRLQAVYSASGQSADEVIVRTLRESDTPASYLVVTSDMKDIGRTARALGCEVIGSKRFLQRLDAATDGGVTAGDKPDPDDEDPDYWLSRFDEADG